MRIGLLFNRKVMQRSGRNLLSLRYITLALLLLSIMFGNSKAPGKKITIADQQKYLAHIHKARQLYSDSLYQQACDEFKTAFSYRNDFVIDLFTCAESFDKLKNVPITLKYLKLSIENGCDWYEEPEKLPNLKKSEKYLPLSQFEKNKQLFYTKINTDYLLALEGMVSIDQSIRKITKSDLSQITDEKAKSKLMGIIDSTNMEELKVLIEKYGYPKYSTVGYKGVTDVFILLLHGLFDGVHDSLDWAYYQPIILKEVKDASLMPEHYAHLYDRVISDYGKREQCYGMQVSIGDDYSLQLTPIYDIENVDLRRREIGLFPLEDDLKRAKMKLPVGYNRK